MHATNFCAQTVDNVATKTAKPQKIQMYMISVQDFIVKGDFPAAIVRNLSINIFKVVK